MNLAAYVTVEFADGTAHPGLEMQLSLDGTTGVLRAVCSTGALDWQLPLGDASFVALTTATPLRKASVLLQYEPREGVPRSLNLYPRDDDALQPLFAACMEQYLSVDASLDEAGQGASARDLVALMRRSKVPNGERPKRMRE